MDNKGFAYSSHEVNTGFQKCNEASLKSNVRDAQEFAVAVKSQATWVPGSKDDPFRGYRIGTHCLMVAIWICLGLFAEIIGPTLPDLKDSLGVNYEEVSQALIGKSVGTMAGAILGGFLHERYNRHTELIMAVGLFLGAAGTVVTPFSVTLGMLAAMFSVSGLGAGLIDSGGNTMVLHLWGERAAVPMQSLHFGFGLGALIAPQVVQPFLSPDAATDDEAITTSAPWVTSDAFWNGTSVPPGESRINIPYGIIAGLITMFAFVVLGHYFKGPPNNFPIRVPNKTFKTMMSPASCGKGFVFFGVELLICLFIYFMQALGGESAMGKFLFSFAVESEVQFSNKDASNLQTAYWGSFTAGRLLGVPIASVVPVRYMILGYAIGGTITATTLAIFAYSNRLALWVCSCIMGLFMSVVYPNGMSWANIYLDMNSVGVMTLIVGGSSGSFIYQYLAGYLFERDPRYLMYFMVGYAASLIVIFIIMQSLASVHSKQIAAKIKERDGHNSEEDAYVIVVSGNEEEPAASTINTPL